MVFNHCSAQVIIYSWYPHHINYYYYCYYYYYYYY